MADTKTAVRKCPSEYKDDNGNLFTCDTVLPKGQPECPKKSRHLNPHPTGFCMVGFHEGTKSKGANGKPVQVCQLWQKCPCQCHKDLDMLFTMSGQMRMPQENVEYHVDRSSFVIPTVDVMVLDDVSSSVGHTVDTPRVEVAAPGVTPPTVKRTFTPTPTGRAGRGQLELWVKEACDEYLVEKYERPWTPAEIAAWIIRYKGVGTQSQGAINAVFERWVSLGFAVIEKKPTRFVEYTPEGVRMGLDAMKARAKAAAKRKLSDRNRGIRS